MIETETRPEIEETYDIGESPRREGGNNCTPWIVVDRRELTKMAADYARSIGKDVMVPSPVADRFNLKPIPITSPPMASTVLYTYTHGEKD